MTDTSLKLGDRFTITNKDKPVWCEGEFIVTEILESGYRVKRVEK